MNCRVLRNARRVDGITSEGFGEAKEGRSGDRWMKCR